MQEGVRLAGGWTISSLRTVLQLANAAAYGLFWCLSSASDIKVECHLSRCRNKSNADRCLHHIHVNLAFYHALLVKPSWTEGHS